jgi:hypothetical protein
MKKGEGFNGLTNSPIVLPPLLAEECTKNDFTIQVFANFHDG